MTKPEVSSRSPYRLLAALCGLSLVGVLLLVIRIIESDSFRYIFLIWNLILAAAAPMLAWWLVSRVRRYGWADWKQFYLTFVWVVFLPNSFYVLTDFIHLRQTYEASLLYDIVMLMSFVFASLFMGLMSIYLVHKELEKRLKSHQAWTIVAGLLLASSFAVCLGRFTRWNTWDILLKPAGLLFDVSDRLINPAAHGDTYQLTALFFVLLLATYWVVWEAIRLVKAPS